MAELDYIGPDPAAWVIRLVDVCDRSQFTATQKTLIERRLLQLLEDLKR